MSQTDVPGDFGLDELEAMMESQMDGRVEQEPEARKTPELYTMVQAKQDWGLEGEDYNFLVLTLTTAVGGGMICMTGLSRSGKDYITSAAQAMFPNPDESWYKMPTSGTESEFFRSNAPKNNARVHRYHDIVNLEDWIEAILKDHGEGEPAIRRINVQTDDGDWVPQPFQIDVPDAIVFFLASDNSQVDLNDKAELRNRALVSSTDASQGLTEQIQFRQGQEVAWTYTPNINPEDVQAIRDHIGSIPYRDYDLEHDSTDFFNPTGEEFARQHPIPGLFVEARHDSRRMWKFANVVTMWNYKDRMQAPAIKNGRQYTPWLVTPEDMWTMMRVFGEKLVMSTMSLRELDQRIIWYLRENIQPHSVSMITQILSQAGFNVTPTDVRDACESLMEKNYIQKNDSGGVVEYQATQFAVDVDLYRPIDWQAVIDDAARIADEVLVNPEDAEEYKRRFCGTVEVRHPVTGEVHDITEYEGFTEQVERQREELAQMLGTSVYEAQIKTDEPEEDEEEQSDSTQERGDGQQSLGGTIGN